MKNEVAIVSWNSVVAATKLREKTCCEMKKCNITLSCWYLGLKKEIRKIFGVCLLSLLPTLYNKLSYISTGMS